MTANTTSRIKFTHMLNGPQGNSHEVLVHAVNEVLAYEPLARASRKGGFNQTVWQGRAAYLVNHVYNRNIVSMATSVDVLAKYVAAARQYLATRGAK